MSQKWSGGGGGEQKSFQLGLEGNRNCTSDIKEINFCSFSYFKAKFVDKEKIFNFEMKPGNAKWIKFICHPRDGRGSKHVVANKAKTELTPHFKS